MALPSSSLHHSFETRLGRSTLDPADPGLKQGWVEEKTGKEKTRCDPADPTS